MPPVVVDSGKGIERRSSIGSSIHFFTTKGRASARPGLSVVHGIVPRPRRHDRRHQRAGPRPRCRDLFPEHARRGRRERVPGAEFACAGGQHVLFLDDEESLVRLAKRLLDASATGQRFVTRRRRVDAMRDKPQIRLPSRLQHARPSGSAGRQLVGMIRPSCRVILPRATLRRLRDSAGARESAACCKSRTRGRAGDGPCTQVLAPGAGNLMVWRRQRSGGRNRGIVHVERVRRRVRLGYVRVMAGDPVHVLVTDRARAMLVQVLGQPTLALQDPCD